MKKMIIVLFCITMMGIFFNQDQEEIFIPDHAIRFRVIANSDSIKDQTEKMVIKNEIESKIYSLIEDKTNVEEVRKTIKDNLNTIEDIVKDYHIPYDIHYGDNYFPAKTYKGVVYAPGNYESLVITLGEGYGKNFWCVLFPPLCLMDTENNNLSDVEYKSYVKEVLDKF